MIKPHELDTEAPYGPWSCRGCDVWEVLSAAAEGDVATLRSLLARDPNLVRAEYWYTQPIRFAVREGHAEAVRLLLDAGADVDFVALTGDNLITIALDRGHEAVAQMLEAAQESRGRVTPADDAIDHEIHRAAARNDVDRATVLLDADPSLVHRSDATGGTPLHRAAAVVARDLVELLLARGADIHALHGAATGYAPADFQPIDLALWIGSFWNVHGDIETARLLVENGAAHDLVVASALGDIERVETILAEDPGRINEARPCGKRALSSAVERGNDAIVRLLLENGADPNLPEGPAASRGVALHAASRTGDAPTLELLLTHGADPNSTIDSSGSATYVAATPELRARLQEAGGTLDTYDLVWLDEVDEAVRRVTADPRTANQGCGGVLAAACTRGKRDLLVRLLEAGARVPPVLTACRSYLWSEPGMLRLLLESGMDPDLPDWLHATPLHDLCSRDGRGRPRAHRVECATLFLDAGADISARDEDGRSTPLAWAARDDLEDMVELLLARGAPTRLPDDETWAMRRGHTSIVETLRGAGATA